MRLIDIKQSINIAWNNIQTVTIQNLNIISIIDYSYLKQRYIFEKI